MNKRAQAQYEKMTQTPITQLLIMLSIPSILSMMVSNIYNMADTAFVGRLGTSASGAVGIVFGFMAILQAIGFMFGQGGGSMMSRKLGAQATEDATRIASTSFFGAFFLAAVVAGICYIFLDPLIVLLGSTPTIAPYARTYISCILVAAPFLVTSFTMNNLLRYEGKAALGMVGMMAGAILNIIGDPILMFGLKLGILGAGISTAISQIISFCILISMFLRGKTTCKIKLSYFTKDYKEFLEILATGVPALLRQSLASVSTILLNSAAAVYGDAAIAAMSIVSRICFFVFSIGLGIGQGFQPISAFNYGAKKYKRLRKAFWIACVFSTGLIFTISIVVLFFSGSLVQIFRDDAEVISIGTRALRLQVISQLFVPIGMITEMLFQSTGQKTGAALLSSFRNGIFFIPCILILPQIRGLVGIQEAQPLAQLLSIIPAVFFLYRLFRKLPTEDQSSESDSAY